MRNPLKNVLLVTGGAGFIGSEYVRQESKSDFWDEIIVIDALTYASDLTRIQSEIDSGRAKFIEGRVEHISNHESLYQNLSHIVHFAAETHVDRSILSGSPFLKSNIDGAYAILEFARQRPNIRTLIVSTDEVYGSILNGEATEDSKLNAASVYSATKASADLLALANHATHSQDVVITRCCNNYGPFQTPEKLIPLAICNLLSGLKVPVYGSGENIREWIYVSDHTKGIQKALLKGASGEIFNIGTGQRLTNLEIIKIIIKYLEMDESFIEFVSDRKGHDFRYAISSEKIRNELDWFPEIELEHGLELTINHYRKLKDVNL